MGTSNRQQNSCISKELFWTTCLFAVALKEAASNLWNNNSMQDVGNTIVSPFFCWQILNLPDA